MNQTSIFDQHWSEKLKRQGMERSADNNKNHLELARGIAREIAERHPFRECDADMVGTVMQARHGIETLGPAAGSLFKGGDWVWTGRFAKSARISNHGRLLRVWRLVA